MAKAGNSSIKGLINQKSQLFKKINPPLDNMDEAGAIELLKAYPRVMLRPIITSDAIFITGFQAAEYEAKL